MLEAVFDIALAVAAALGALLAKPLPTRLLVVLASASSLLLAMGAFSSRWLYPWTNLAVLAFALAAGTALGRLIPPRALPLVALLLALAVADLWLNHLPAPASPSTAPRTLPSALLYGNVVVILPNGGRLLLGALDIALCAALAVHAHRRALPRWAGILPGPIGVGLGFLWMFLRSVRGLPLIPFFFAGWLLVEGAQYLARLPRARP
ncbi:MAG: hypothetical protein ABWJ63_03460 [Thermus sp.]|uniref:hypothetical protein n=1 Tax=Thermus sp. TaxID=275 RepID=UPI00351B588C